jgi:hypothetical protein
LNIAYVALWLLNRHRSKIQLIHDVLALASGLSIVVSDIDTMWMRNPLPFFDRFKTADILTSTGATRISICVQNSGG